MNLTVRLPWTKIEVTGHSASIRSALTIFRSLELGSSYQAWIKLSPLTFTFQHVKGHQTDKVAYSQLDWWGKHNETIDAMAKNFLHTCTAGSSDNRKAYVQPLLHLKKWALARDGTKFANIYRDSLYTNLYGSCTLACWAEKDDISKDPKRILWEESQLAMKRVTKAQRRIGTKLLCNQCGFAKTNNKIPIPVRSVIDLSKIEIMCLLVKNQQQ